MNRMRNNQTTSIAMESQFSTGQILALTFVQSTAAIASILGSSSVCFLSFRRRRMTPVKERLLFALGVLDIINSTGCLLNPFLYPRDDNGILHTGNIHTCTIVGIMGVFGGLGVSVCNASLALYFYFTVVRRWRKSDLRIAERVWFAIMVFLPISLCVAGVATRSFGPKPDFNGCYINGEYPLTGCRERNDCDYGGSRLSVILGLAVVGCMAIASIVAFVATSKVWADYRRRVRASSRYLMIGSQEQQSHRNLEEVSKQAIGYSVAYINVFFWPLVAGILEKVEGTNRAFVFCFTLIGMHMYAFQGMFNAAIYMRPSFVHWRQIMPDASFWSVLRKCYSTAGSNQRSTARKLTTNRSSSRTVIDADSKRNVAVTASPHVELPEHADADARASVEQDVELPSGGGV